MESGVYHRARLRGARLARSIWVDCDLAHADLSSADLRLADLSGGVSLLEARLRGARLAGADLGGADLAGADLTDADLTNVNLAGARLAGAKLDRADLRGARGVAIDANSAAGAKLSYNLVNQWTPLTERGQIFAATLLDPRWLRRCWCRLLYGPLPEPCRVLPPVRKRRVERAAGYVRSLFAPADLWFALKRTYTGPWLFLNLLALLAFFLPRLELGIARISVEQLQLGDRVQATRDLAQRHAELAPPEAKRAIDALLTPTARTYERVPLWWVLLGLHRGWIEAALSLLVLAYVVMRTMLTMVVSQLAHIELNNGITPSIDHYRRLIWAHLCTRALMGVATWVFLVDLYRLLQLEVSIAQR